MSSFPNKIDNETNLITCPENIGSELVEEIKNQSKNWLLQPIVLHILDFKNTETLDPLAYQPFVLFKQNLKNGRKHLFSINLKSSLKNEIQAQGLEQVFSPCGSIKEAQTKSGLRSKNSIDAEFLAPFLEGTKQTLAVQADINIQAKKPFIKNGKFEYEISIAGVISLISEHFTGSITLCFPGQTFLGVYNKMFEEENTEITEEIEDAAGELLNIIYGMAKATLNNNKGYELMKAIPTVLTADKLRIRQQGSGPVVVLPFDSPVGPFHIEIEAEDS